MKVIHIMIIFMFLSCASYRVKDLNYVQNLSSEMTLEKMQRDLGKPDKIVYDKRMKDRFGAIYKRNGKTIYTFSFSQKSKKLESATYYVPIESKLYYLESAKSYFKMKFKKEQDFLGPHSGSLKTSYVNEDRSISLEMYNSLKETVQFIHFNY